MDDLQQRIGIAFRDVSLLQEALTHSSFANESPHLSPRDNERLEYLGDAVLQLITAEYLYKYRPGANEGEMTQIRSAMVNTNTLAALAEELGLGDHLYLGKGISKGGGRSLKSLLANAFEAVLGAVFLDAGYDAAYHYYLDRFRQLPEPVKDENFKGRLQQVVQERFNQTPFYDSAGARVGNQRREYTAVVFAGAEALGTGHGHTKQEAEQDAARDALAKLTGAAPAAATRDGRSRRRRSSTRAEEPLAEPVAETEVGGEEPVAPKPRRRRSPRRKAAAVAEPAAEAAAEAPAPEPPPEPPKSRQFGAPPDEPG
ncbi:MAG TPA: ribonuclease III [Candidatus Dormibacteraeota bacterium]